MSSYKKITKADLADSALYEKVNDMVDVLNSDKIERSQVGIRKGSTSYKVGDKCFCEYHGDFLLECTTAGTSAVGQLDTSGTVTDGATRTDGSVVWTFRSIATKKEVNDLATVAKSGKYGDLLDKPTIPTKTSQLTNDSNFVNTTQLATKQNNLTTAQLNAANSGITSAKVSKYDGYEATITSLQTSKQDKISDLATIRSGASKGATAVQPSAISDMESKTHASATYQPKGDYATNSSVNTKLAGKQDTLVSGTNIKTVGGQSLIGSGDIPSGGGMPIGMPFTIATTSSYVPDGCVPCDGSEYTRAQYPAFYDNYLIGTGTNVPVYAWSNSTSTVYTYSTTGFSECYTLRNGQMTNATTCFLDGGILTTRSGIEYQRDSSKDTTVSVAAPKLKTTTYSAYNSAVSSYGYCDLIALDTTNQKFKVQTMPNGIYLGAAPSSFPVVGNGMSIGITDGNLKNGVAHQRGIGLTAYEGNYGANVGTENSGTSIASGNVALGLTTDGSKSGMISNASGQFKVASDFKWFVCIANATVNESAMDWSAYQSGLASKVDKSNLVSAHAVVERWSDGGTNWYNLYDDKWVEQGGTFPSNDTAYTTVTLFKKMATALYSPLVGMMVGNAGLPQYRVFAVTGITKESITILNNTGGTNNCCWRVSGYAE